MAANKFPEEEPRPAPKPKPRRKGACGVCGELLALHTDEDLGACLAAIAYIPEGQLPAANLSDAIRLAARMGNTVKFGQDLSVKAYRIEISGKKITVALHPSRAICKLLLENYKGERV